MGGLFYFMFLPVGILCYRHYLKVTIYPLSPKARILVRTYFMMVLLVCLLNPLESTVVFNSFFFLLPGLALFFKDFLLNRPADARRHHRSYYQ